MQGAVGGASAPTRQKQALLEAEVEELRALVAELEDERAQLSDFAAMAAHELLRPLMMAEAYAEMMRDRVGHGLDLESRRDLDALIRISGRVRRVVETMLLDACERASPLRTQEVDLTYLISDCLRELDEEIRARGATLEIERMPVVEADPALLSSVFGNLLSNALRYGARKGDAIHVAATRTEVGWMFTVESAGPPIPEGERDRIFEPWSRGRNERRAYGAGLGLAIVRHIVERHGGHIGVRPLSGRGNSFFFTLPDSPGAPHPAPR
jgi:signal transduction histidine kinase